jgi:uncharacterized protein with GYD domain
MGTYFIFETVTREGKMTVTEAPVRSEAVEAAAAAYGVRVIEWFFTTTPVDFVMKVDADDDTQVLAFVMAVQRSGNVEAQWSRAYTPEEWKAMVGKIV